MARCWEQRLHWYNSFPSGAAFVPEASPPIRQSNIWECPYQDCQLVQLGFHGPPKQPTDGILSSASLSPAHERIFAVSEDRRKLLDGSRPRIPLFLGSIQHQQRSLHHGGCGDSSRRVAGTSVWLQRAALWLRLVPLYLAATRETNTDNCKTSKFM